MTNKDIKSGVQKLRAQGKTYAEIKKILALSKPKSTLSCWCRGMKLPKWYSAKIQKINQKNLIKARALSVMAKKQLREKLFDELNNKNRYLMRFLNNKDIGKLVLVALYLAEGSKFLRGSIAFGNSDPVIIRLFLKLLRLCYNIDENKFRCALQCRADQDIKTLEVFWSKTTSIPLSQFYKARIDPRTIGKKTKKLEYKGVCRIDYFSAALDKEIKSIINLISKAI